MKSLVRLVFGGIAAISLLLCIAAAILWLRSYGPGDSFTFAAHGNGPHHQFVVQVWTSSGQLQVDLVAAESLGSLPESPTTGFHRASAPPFAREPVRPHGPLGFGYSSAAHHEIFSDEAGNSWVAPLWLPVAVTALLPAAWILTRRRKRRDPAAARYCAACGHELRDASGRCPNCGNISRNAA